jgi:hypothetical protein
VFDRFLAVCFLFKPINNTTNTSNIMIIWQGCGGLVAIITFISALIANIIADSAGGQGYWERHKWPLGVALVISGVISWYLGDYIRIWFPGRVVIDKKTGKEFTIERRHTLFFIPMNYWGPILIGFGLIAFLVDLFH